MMKVRNNGRLRGVMWINYCWQLIHCPRAFATEFKMVRICLLFGVSVKESASVNSSALLSAGSQ